MAPTEQVGESKLDLAVGLAHVEMQPVPLECKETNPIMTTYMAYQLGQEVFVVARAAFDEVCLFLVLSRLCLVCLVMLPFEYLFDVYCGLSVGSRLSSDSCC